MTEVVKAVSMLHAFERAPESIGAPILVYPNLESESKLAKDREYAWLDRVWESPAGSIEEWDFARRAAVGYLIRTALQLRDSSPQYWSQISERITEASSEIYGAPEADEAKKLILRQLPEFVEHLGDPTVDQERLQRIIDFWTIADNTAEVTDSDQELEQVRGTFGAALEEKFGGALKFTDPENFDQVSLSPQEIVENFEQAVVNLAKSYPEFRDWKVELSNGAAINTDTESQIFKVGKNRSPLEVKRLKGRVYHEVIGHALRYMNGKATGDKSLETALPGSLDTEEGFCNFMGYSLGDEISDNVYERYIDTAAAMGLIGKPAISRPEMHQLYLDRLIVRKQIAGGIIDEAKASNEAWGYVNRIYRGTFGNEYIGVNTKDVVYHPGFVNTANYVKSRLDAGVDAKALLDYMLICIFDPTNPKHRAYLDQHGYPEPQPQA